MPDDTPEFSAVTGDRASRPISRRSALKAMGLGGATILVGASGAASYRVFDNGVLDAGSGAPYDAWSQWRDDDSPKGAVGAAILAANPHNTQPWIFHVTDRSVDVFADPSRDMPAVDPYRREHHVGLGCAVENLVLGLGARGFRAEVKWLPDPADETYVAAVAFEPAPVSTSSLHEVIGDRHSNRGPYRAQRVPRTVLEGLSAHVAESPDVQLRWLASDSDREAMSALILEATEAFIDDRGQSEESFSWFRNSRDDIDKHRDGPTLDAQGFSTTTLTVAKLLPASSRSAGDRFWLDQTRTVHTATAAAYGIITVPGGDHVTDRLQAGRVLQRIHLAATADGLALQHMNQVTERIDRERQLGLPATFAPRLQDLVAQPGRGAVVAFRLGHAIRTARPSPRRPLGAVIR